MADFMPNMDELFTGMVKKKIREELEEEKKNSDGIEKTASEVVSWFLGDKGKMY